ncbi:ABC transporter permease [Corynebacterium sp. CCM 9185]|nr:ABC transporter permease [Corynebacterium marambiense]MCK7664235.1 ABC transporter permease [Corynebacterium marambiense]MCX7543457.1 ABC transporter permease [Corynebacterium marambiense]
MKRTLSTSARLTLELIRDRRLAAQMLVLPTLLLTLLYFVYRDYPGFTIVAQMLLGLMPMVMMFIVAAVAVQRERTAGSLERLWTTCLTHTELLVGYALAFGGFAVVQAAVMLGVAHQALGVDPPSGVLGTAVVSLLSGVTGAVLGLVAGSFSRNEFQAVQMVPLVIGPQLFLSGIFVPTAAMPRALQWFSDSLPLTYAVKAQQHLAVENSVYSGFGTDMLILSGFSLGGLVMAALFMQRRT